MMEQDIQKLEAELAALRPAEFDPALADRLVRAVEGRAAEFAPGERAFEHELRALKPSPPGEAARAAFSTVLERLPFPASGNVVPFPGPSRSRAPRRRNRLSWAAAAVVALAGGLTALLVGPREDRAVAALREDVPRSARPAQADPEAFSPAAFESGVSDTHDFGRVWTGAERAMRVVKVTFKDRVVWLNEHGEEVVTEIPRVEYLVVPEQVD